MNGREWIAPGLTVLGLGLGLSAGFVEIKERARDGAASVASVNGAPILREDFARALAALSSDKKAPLSDTDRDHVRERLIEEELLAARALELGLGQSDPNARKVLVRSLIDFVIASAPAPSETELTAFYEDNTAFFRRPLLLEVRAEDAQLAARLPATPMTIAKLRDYLGEEADRLASAEGGARVGPLTINGRAVWIAVITKQGGDVPPFAAIRAEVADRFRTARDAMALRSYIADLKRKARIERFAPAP